MKTQESPPPANRSNPFLKWTNRELLVIAAALMLWVFAPHFDGIFPHNVRETAKRVKTQIDVESFATALDSYAVEYGYHPERAPAELLRTLRGDNKRKIVFFECAARSVNAGGEFTDPWGQPYHIDQSDPSSPRVYSSGPNRLDEHGAKGSDDIVAKPRVGK
jgi:hypothetical protein